MAKMPNVEKLPSGAWRVTVQLAGRRRRGTAATYAEAKTLRTKLLAELGATTTSARRRQPGTRTTTIGQLLDLHLEQAEYAATTLADRKSVVERIPDTFKARLVVDIQAADLDALYRELIEGGLSPFRVRVVHNLISAAFKRALRWQWVHDNPCRSAEPPKLPEPEVRPADRALVAKVVKAIAHDQTFSTFVRLAAVTGARRGELCGLQWADVDLAKRRITVRRAVAVTSASGVVVKDTKTGVRGRRSIAIDPATTAMLKALRASTAKRLMKAGVGFGDELWVFSDHVGTRPWRPDRPTKRWGRVCTELGIKGVNIKGLRHLVATELISAGVDIETVSGRLGHARTSTTLNHYSHWMPERDRHAADIMAKRLA